MTFQQLGKYKDFIFLSTDLGHQLMIDMKKNSVINLSETESPYNRLFSSPLCVGKDGQFCCVISSSDIGTKFLEKLNGKDSKLPKLQTVYEKEDIEDEEEETITVALSKRLSNFEASLFFFIISLPEII